MIKRHNGEFKHGFDVCNNKVHKAVCCVFCGFSEYILVLAIMHKNICCYVPGELFSASLVSFVGTTDHAVLIVFCI